jgi:general secretion pathway protein L
MPLPGLAGAIAGAQRVVLLLAAADVALLRVKAPPLSHARLKAALPNLIEDQLIGDPGGCVVAAGGTHDGLRTIAAIQRTWLEHLAKTLIALGARRIAALPAQLCLPYQPDQPGQTVQPDQLGQPDQLAQPGITAAIDGRESGTDLTLRLSEHDGIGLTIAPAPGQEEGQTQQTAAHEVIRALRAVAPGAPITLYVPQAQVSAYQQAPAYRQAIDDTGTPGQRISVLADNWAHWIAGSSNAAPDLMAGLGAAAGPGMDWRAWRWPLILAAAILLTNIAALNFDWWRKKTEAGALRASMTQIYKAAYPKETVIIDPIAQMRQKIAAAKRDAGLPSPDDFTSLAAAFGEACATAMPGKTATAIAALEYRERGLIVQLKPGVEAPAGPLATLLAERGLSLDLMPAQNAAVVWQIRGAK